MAEMIDWTDARLTKKKQQQPSIPKIEPSPINYDIYLKANFPMIVGECQVAYKYEWESSHQVVYRLNFYKEDSKKSSMGFPILKMTRSLYVKIIIDEESVRHEVHKD